MRSHIEPSPLLSSLPLLYMTIGLPLDVVSKPKCKMLLLPNKTSSLCQCHAVPEVSKEIEAVSEAVSKAVKLHPSPHAENVCHKLVRAQCFVQWNMLLLKHLKRGPGGLANGLDGLAGRSGTVPRWVHHPGASIATDCRVHQMRMADASHRTSGQCLSLS